MKNVLFIHSSSELYGSDRSLLNIVKNIDKTNFKVFVVLPCLGPLVDEIKKIQGVQLDIFEVAVLRRKNLSVKGGISYLKEFNSSVRYLKTYIEKNEIDIVDTNTAAVFSGAIVAKRCKKKCVWHIREIIKSNLENRVVSFMMQHYSDLIIANSKATGEALKVLQDKVRVVYNAVEEVSNNSLISHQQLTVGMAGRINRWKGQKLFVDMAEVVHRKYPDVLFKIAGEAYMGEEYLKSDLQDYINIKGLQETVLLLGQINNMSSFYSGLDIFVLPSIHPEPFGLVVIEAMEFGIPVVATNHGGPVEIISEGIDGYLVSHEDCAEMAERVKNLINSEELRRKMGNEGLKKKREQFSVPAMVKGVEAVFEESLSH